MAIKELGPKTAELERKAGAAKRYTAFRTRILEIAAKEIEPLTLGSLVDLIVKEVKLYYTNPAENSDKVYVVRIVKIQANGLYKVNYEHGKRNAANLTKGTRTPIPVKATEAERIMAEVISEKKGKGYTTNVSGKPYSS